MVSYFLFLASWAKCLATFIMNKYMLRLLWNYFAKTPKHWLLIAGILVLSVSFGVLQTAAPVHAAADCKSNANFPLQASTSGTGACLGKVDNGLYSFEISTFVAGSIDFTVTGSGLAGGPYVLNAVNGGDTGIYYVSAASGTDAYGDKAGVLISANTACGDTITLKGTDKDTGQKGSIGINPCDLIQQYKDQGKVSFGVTYTSGQTGSQSDCHRNAAFPMMKSPNTQACIGVVDAQKQSFEFLVQTPDIANAAISMSGAALLPPPDTSVTRYRFTNEANGSHISEASGKDAYGDVVSVLVSESCAAADQELAITATSPTGEQGKMRINACYLESAAKSCNNWQFVLTIQPNTNWIFNFDRYTCAGGGITGSDCSPPFTASVYNPNECLGRLSDKLISVDLIVTIQNATPDDRITLTASSAGRILPCDATNNCGPNRQSDEFEQVDQYVYHSAAIPTSQFALLYSDGCSILNTSACGTHPDPTKYPAYSGTGVGEGNPCSQNDSTTITAVSDAGYSGTAIVGNCSIINNGYVAHVTISLNAPADICNTGTGRSGLNAFSICPMWPYVINATQFTSNMIMSSPSTASTATPTQGIDNTGGATASNPFTSLLAVTPLNLTNPNDPIFRAWDAFRNVANVLLIVIFVICIISQATSIGVSRYGLKRLLPRLLTAAVMANSIYYILAVLIDGFNIVGAGVAQFALDVLQSSGLKGNGVEWGGVFTVLAVGIITVAKSAGAALPWLFGLAVTIGLIVLGAVIALVLRAMIMGAIVIISSILCVAAVLDATRSFYVKTRDLFLALAFMYWLIALAMVSGKLFGLLFASGFNLGSSDPHVVAITQAIDKVMATLSAALPLLLLIVIFKRSKGIVAAGYTFGREFNVRTQGLRMGLLAGLGNTTIGTSKWAAAHPVLSTLHRRPLDFVLGGYSMRMQAAAKQAHEQQVAAYNLSMAANPAILTPAARAAQAAALTTLAGNLSKQYEQEQVLLEANVLGKVGVSNENFLSDVTSYLNNPTVATAIIEGRKGKIDLQKRLGDSQFWAAAAQMAATSGNLSTLSAMITSNKLTGESRQNVINALSANEQKIKDANGAFLLDKAMYDPAQARQKVANLFQSSEEGWRLTAGADMRTLMDLYTLHKMVTGVSAQQFQKASADYKGLIRDTLVRGTTRPQTAINPERPAANPQLDRMITGLLGGKSEDQPGGSFTKGIVRADAHKDVKHNIEAVGEHVDALRMLRLRFDSEYNSQHFDDVKQPMPEVKKKQPATPGASSDGDDEDDE